MGNKQVSKARIKKSSLEFTLVSTRLKKLTVETNPPSQELAKGKLELSYKAAINLADDSNSVLLNFGISGKGISTENPEKTDLAFVFEAEIDGIYSLSRKSDINEMEGRETQLVNYLTPLLSDMVESMLIKCGYTGVSLAKSITFNSENIRT